MYCRPPASRAAPPVALDAAAAREGEREGAQHFFLLPLRAQLRVEVARLLREPRRALLRGRRASECPAPRAGHFEDRWEERGARNTLEPCGGARRGVSD
jgi:hypothetical protein